MGAALKNWPNEVTVIWYSRKQSAWSCRQEDEFVAELKTGPDANASEELGSEAR